MSKEHKKGLNADLVWSDLQNCCMSESTCGSERGPRWSKTDPGHGF